MRHQNRAVFGGAGAVKSDQGLLAGHGLRFPAQVHRQAARQIGQGPHPINALLHLTVTAVAPLHRIRGRGQQLVVQKRQGLLQVR